MLIIKAIYVADAADGSFYYKSVFHPRDLRAMPDPHPRHSKMVTAILGETFTPQSSELAVIKVIKVINVKKEKKKRERKN